MSVSILSVVTAWLSDNDSLAGDNSGVHNSIILSPTTWFS